ncbi:MAG: sigma-70 family RNA polymerase sigma factor [Pseudomonadota bacterium]
MKQRPALKPVDKLTSDYLCSLIERIAESRDREAFEALYRHFAPRLKAYGMRAGADAITAEELAQEAMIMVWRKAASFDRRKATVSTWLFTIVRNKRIDLLRRQNRPEIEADDLIAMTEPERPQDEAMALQQTDAIVRQSMEILPDDQKTVLAMAFFEEKSHSQIAEDLSLPLGTVKSRIRLAMNRMKGRLSKELPA